MTLTIPFRAAIPGTTLLGSVLLGVGTLGSLLLALAHFDIVELPGCGLESACAAAAASRWGTVPLVGWPTSFLGLAYFEAMLAAWILSRGQLPQALMVVMRLGATVSLLLVAAILVEGYLCVYCLKVHAANLLWVAGVEWSRRRARESVKLTAPGRRRLLPFQVPPADGRNRLMDRWHEVYRLRG